MGTCCRKEPDTFGLTGENKQFQQQVKKTQKQNNFYYVDVESSIENSHSNQKFQYNKQLKSLDRSKSDDSQNLQKFNSQDKQKVQREFTQDEQKNQSEINQINQSDAIQKEHEQQQLQIEQPLLVTDLVVEDKVLLEQNQQKSLNYNQVDKELKNLGECVQNQNLEQYEDQNNFEQKENLIGDEQNPQQSLKEENHIEQEDPQEQKQDLEQQEIKVRISNLEENQQDQDVNDKGIYDGDLEESDVDEEEQQDTYQFSQSVLDQKKSPFQLKEEKRNKTNIQHGSKNIPQMQSLQFKRSPTYSVKSPHESLVLSYDQEDYDSNKFFRSSTIGSCDHNKRLMLNQNIQEWNVVNGKIEYQQSPRQNFQEIRSQIEASLSKGEQSEQDLLQPTYGQLRHFDKPKMQKKKMTKSIDTDAYFE